MGILPNHKRIADCGNESSLYCCTCLHVCGLVGNIELAVEARQATWCNYQVGLFPKITVVVFGNSFASISGNIADGISPIKWNTDANCDLYLWGNATRCMGSTSSQLQKTMKLTKLSMGVHASTHAPRRTRQKVTPGFFKHKNSFFTWAGSAKFL